MNKDHVHGFWKPTTLVLIFAIFGASCDGVTTTNPLNPLNLPTVTMLPTAWIVEEKSTEKKEKRWHTLQFINKTQPTSDPRFDPSLIVDKISLIHNGGEEIVTLVTGKCPKESPKAPRKPGDRDYCVDGVSLPHKVKSGESLRFSLEAILKKGWTGVYKLHLHYHNIVTPIYKQEVADHAKTRGFSIYIRGLAPPIKTGE